MRVFCGYVISLGTTRSFLGGQNHLCKLLASVFIGGGIGVPFEPGFGEVGDDLLGLLLLPCPFEDGRGIRNLRWSREGS